MRLNPGTGSPSAGRDRFQQGAAEELLRHAVIRARNGLPGRVRDRTGRRRKIHVNAAMTMSTLNRTVYAVGNVNSFFFSVVTAAGSAATGCSTADWRWLLNVGHMTLRRRAAPARQMRV